MNKQLKKNQHLAYISLLVAVSLVLYIFENTLPKPVPWIRLGLANLITLWALLQLNFKSALIIVLLRIFLGSLLSGILFTPIFILTLSGGLASIIIMGIAKYLWYPKISPLGISWLGAATHNIFQLLAAYIVLSNEIQIFYLLPIFLLTSIITGAIIGLIISLLLPRWQRINYAGASEKTS